MELEVFTSNQTSISVDSVQVTTQKSCAVDLEAKDKGILAPPRKVHCTLYCITDAYTFHQPKDGPKLIKNVLEDIQDAEKKNLTVNIIPGPAKTAVDGVDIANTGMSQLDTISSVYLQPLTTFAKVVTGIGKVCPFN